MEPIEDKDDYTKKYKITSTNYVDINVSTYTLETLLKRPEFTFEILSKYIDIPFEDDIKDQVSINLKYEGYINKAIKEAEKLIKLEEKHVSHKTED